ncbi:MAG: tetratricopeptide repeat protein [Alphaproteobacteria bacterium]|nr:tetratricopeptide repeat protein [Alphaproteobacteria bacterium]
MSEASGPRRAAGGGSFRDRIRAAISLEPGAILRTSQLLIAYVPIAAATLALAWQLGFEAFDNSLAIEPISVPSSLNGQGYTPAVVAQRLDDAVAAIMAGATTRMKREHISVGGEEALVPASSSQFAGLISSALHFFHLSSRSYVTGEITERKGSFSLTIRMGGRLAGLKTIGPRDDPDDLFPEAARAIVWQSQPYVVASYDLKNPALALSEADSIIRRYPETDANVAFAHDLKGNILSDRGQTAAAMGEYREAMRLAPASALPHHNLGNIYEQSRSYAKATDEYEKALALDPGFALPHYGLGTVYFDEKRYGDAVAQYRTATQLDPGFTRAHQELGLALFDDGNKAEGLHEMRIAVSQAPSDASLHRQLGNLLFQMRDWDGAMAEYRASLAIAPDDAATHFNLMRAMGFQFDRVGRDQGLVLASRMCDEALAAARLQPKSPDYAYAVRKLCAVEEGRSP